MCIKAKISLDEATIISSGLAEIEH